MKYSKMMKNKDIHPRLLYTARPLCKIEGEIKSLSDKKSKENYNPKDNITRNVKGTILKRRK